MIFALKFNYGTLHVDVKSKRVALSYYTQSYCIHMF